MAVKRLVIEINESDKTVQVMDGETKVGFFQSLVIFAGDAVNNEYLIQMYGASADAAWAVGRAFMLSRTPEAGPGLRNFFKQMAARICHVIDPFMFKQTAGAEETLNKWECEDQSKWGGWDSEDVLEDKQKSEARKAAKVLGPEAIVEGGPDDDDGGPTYH